MRKTLIILGRVTAGQWSKRGRTHCLNREKPFLPDEITALSEIVGCRSALNANITSQFADLAAKTTHTGQVRYGTNLTITDLDKLTDVITRLIQETFDYYYVAIFIIEENSERLRFKAQQVLPNASARILRAQASGFGKGEHMIGFVAETARN